MKSKEWHGIRASWDEWNKSYRSLSRFDLNIKSLDMFIYETNIGRIRNFIKSGGTLLEVGAGTGRFSCLLALRYKCKVTCVDYSTEALKSAGVNFSKCDIDGSVIQADAYSLPFGSESYDMVVSGGVLEHFSNDQMIMIIKEMVRISKPNGLFYCDIEPRKVSTLRLFDTLRIISDEFMPLSKGQPPVFENNISKSELLNMLDKAGLYNARILSAGVFPPSNFPFHGKIVHTLKPIIRLLDNTVVSDLLGFYYIAYGFKK